MAGAVLSLFSLGGYGLAHQPMLRKEERAAREEQPNEFNYLFFILLSFIFIILLLLIIGMKSKWMYLWNGNEAKHSFDEMEA